MSNYQNAHWCHFFFKISRFFQKKNLELFYVFFHNFCFKISNKAETFTRKIKITSNQRNKNENKIKKIGEIYPYDESPRKHIFFNPNLIWWCANVEITNCADNVL